VIRYLANQARADYRALTLDLAGAGGALSDLASLTMTVRDEDGRAVRTASTAIAYGVGTTQNSWIYLYSLLGIFPDYDGSRDTLQVVVTPTGSLTWDELGVGPRILRFKSDNTQNNDAQCFRNTSGTDRLLGANMTGAAAAVYVNSGTFDARAISAVFTVGNTLSGWSDTAPTQGEQISPVKAMSRRASAIVATQTEAALLDLGTTDALAFGLSSIAGTFTSTVTQDADGVTFDLGNSQMKVRYIHLFHSRGE
jgi:hypothetical protein